MKLHDGTTEKGEFVLRGGEVDMPVEKMSFSVGKNLYINYFYHGWSADDKKGRGQANNALTSELQGFVFFGE